MTKISYGYALECGEIECSKFNQIVSRVLEEISAFRPLPPMLGDGKPIELLKLYLCVREKGGYESVNRNRGWDLVAKEIGCDSDASSSLKVVYVKYLGLLEEYFSKVVKDKSSGGESIVMSSFDSSKFFSDAEMKNYQEFVDTVGLKDLQSCVGSIDGLDAKDDAVVESNVGITEEETELSRKRKRERYSPLLDWVKRVAKDPCDLAIGSLPERSKWKGYGSEYVWKQVLSAREARLVKTSLDPKAKHAWKKNLRMNPAMYDDPTEKFTSRCSQRLITAKDTRSSNLSSRKLPSPQDWSESSSSGSRSDRDEDHSFYGYNFKRKRTPLGRQFQAQVPESVEQTYEPDTKWLGTPIWPLAKTETRSSLIEIERIGKGRQDFCGCASPGSIECVRFHVSEKRNRIKLELGSAFLKWEFNEVGESVALKWTPKDEKMFEDIIKANPVSSGITFWSDLWTHFKDKSMAVLVSYYFNVYLYRRRAHQNRSDPSNIDSDDDELENIGNDANNKAAPGSIFCSPKKTHVNAR